MRWLYSLLIYLLTPLVLAYLFIRGLRSRDYLSRWPERFGYFTPPRSSGGIMIHSASMGEVNAASPLIKGLAKRYPQHTLYLTTLTPTGSSRIRELFGDAVFHVYAPLDLPGAVRRFFRRVKPQLLVIMETEIWPNLYHQAAALGIPILIANARISDHSIDNYRRFHKLTSGALEKVSEIAAQSALDAERLIRIGADSRRVTVTGNIKYDLAMPASLSEEGETIKMAWGSQRPVLLAGSTHEGDEGPVLGAFSDLLAEYPDALLVLVPRHPERFSRSAQLARDHGLQVFLRSQGPACPAGTQCFVIDTMGELLRYYAACDFAFVGGSFEAIGGHNPLEPAALGRPVVVGPHTFNFAEITRHLLDCGAAIRGADQAGLESAVRQLFDSPEERDRMGRSGQELVQREQGAVDRTLNIVDQLITRAAG